jgi:hypothetical protein
MSGKMNPNDQIIVRAKIPVQLEFDGQPDWDVPLYTVPVDIQGGYGELLNAKADIPVETFVPLDFTWEDGASPERHLFPVSLEIPAEWIRRTVFEDQLANAG